VAGGPKGKAVLIALTASAARIKSVSFALTLMAMSPGAGAALLAAAEQPGVVEAVVSRGGRPDLAWEHLPSVQAPTLLIVGGNDGVVVQLNEEALRLLQCPKELVVIPGATHLFPERGALEQVARLAGDWFVRYLAPGSRSVDE